MNGPQWIKQWIANLAILNEQFRDDSGKVDFEALGREEYEFRTALITKRLEKSERAKEAYEQAKVAYYANVENGKKGGRPRKNPEEPIPEVTGQGRTGGGSHSGVGSAVPPARSSGKRRIPHPKGSFEVFDFAHENGIPDYVAIEFYQRFFVERDGTDNDGKNIDNWKGALINYNKSKNKEPA